MRRFDRQIDPEIGLRECREFFFSFLGTHTEYVSALAERIITCLRRTEYGLQYADLE